MVVEVEEVADMDIMIMNPISLLHEADHLMAVLVVDLGIALHLDLVQVDMVEAVEVEDGIDLVEQEVVEVVGSSSLLFINLQSSTIK